MRSLMPRARFRPAGFLLLLLAGGFVAGGLLYSSPKPTEAEIAAPAANERQIALIVASKLKREHVSKKPLDDEISQRALKLFLKSLDPMKLYFVQSDIDGFAKYANDLDDMVKKGDVSVSHEIFKVLLARIDERVKTVEELLKGDFDFTVDEELSLDRDKQTYPKDSAEATDRWRKRLKYDLLVLKTEQQEKDKAKLEKDKLKKESKDGDGGAAAEVKPAIPERDPKERLLRRYKSYASRMHKIDNGELLEMFLSAITMSFDPHTTYMSPFSLEDLYMKMRLSLEGIGAALQELDGQTVITKVMPGGAAEKSGKIKAQDRIVSVGEGADGEMTDVLDMRLNDVVKRIRGKAGTVVRLGVIHEGTTEIKIYNITRSKVEMKDEEARSVIFEEGKKADGTPYKIGVIDLPSFYMDMEGARSGDAEFKSTTRDVRKLIDKMKKEGIDALVLDLRRNGGGSLTEAINLTGLFIDIGPVVQVRDPDGRVQKYDDTDTGMAWDGPFVVLQSKFSASASEIFAGAIQDYNRGLIVGDKASHGKGSVQSVGDLGQELFRIPSPPNLGALKLTIQQFYRPDGDSTQERGVLSDVILPSITQHMDVGEADLDYPLAFDRVPKAAYKAYDMLPKTMTADLAARSAMRVQADADFTKLNKSIERYLGQKKKKSVTLNEKTFFAERAELDAEKEEEKLLKDTISPDTKEVVKRDYYFNEVLRIAADYVDALKRTKIAGK